MPEIIPHETIHVWSLSQDKWQAGCSTSSPAAQKTQSMQLFIQSLIFPYYQQMTERCACVWYNACPKKMQITKSTRHRLQKHV